MPTDSYPPPVRLSQAFDGENGSTGSGSSITRRSFLKRTGGATVATLVAWNAVSMQARASETIVDSGSGHSYHWQVRSAPIGNPPVTGNHQAPHFGQTPLDSSTGPEQNWLQGNVWRKVKRCLYLYAWAPACPSDHPFSGKQYGPTAACNVTVVVREWAHIKSSSSGPWRDMTNTEWNQWTGSEPVDSNTFAGLLAKYIADPNAEQPHLATYCIVPSGSGDDTKSEGGIYIKLVWVDDVLNIAFRALGLGIEENDFDLESVWEIANR